MKRLAFVGLAIALASSTASAQTLLNDNFNNLNGGNSALNYTGFPNWNVTSGTVDYLNNFSGLSCVGSPSGCVDLDGSTASGGTMRTQSTFGFTSGQTMRITFDLSGNQRGGTDLWHLKLLFGGLPTGSYSTGGAFGAGSGGPFVGLSSITLNQASTSTDPFGTYVFNFFAQSSGTVQYEIGTSSADNIGPILDNVLIERFDATTVVPEPSTWAMLAFGLGGIGFAGRRRRKV